MTESPVSLIYLDTNVFIKAVEGLDEAASPAKTLIQALRRLRSGVAATSEITFAEVLAPNVRALCRFTRSVAHILICCYGAALWH